MMESKWLWILFTVLLLEGWLCTDACWEHERIALLQLKPFFSPYIDLNNWVEVKGSDCCQWTRVECNTTTRRVIGLSLNYTRWREDHWYLNASLFLPFKELKSLSLQGNSIAGFVEYEGFESLSRLHNLEVLDLSWNSLKNDILVHMGSLSSLKTLDLCSNKLKGTVHLQELNNLTNLKNLYLQYNSIESLQPLYQGNETQLKLTNLEVLDLSYNLFSNNTFAFLPELSSLKTLYMWSNQLQGSIDIAGLNNLINLKKLELSWNKIESLQSFQDNGRQLKLTHLEELDLSGNLFNNSIFASLKGLSNLKSLRINNNKLKGSIDMKDLGAFTNLEELYMSGNELNELVTHKEQDIRKYIGMETRTDLSVPSHLYPLGHMEEWIEFTTKRGSYRYGGEILDYMSGIDLSCNKLTGQIPFELGNLSEIHSLNFSHNKLIGIIPSSFSNLKQIESLDLSYNNLSGTIPVQLVELNFLEVFSVAHNDLSGKTPERRAQFGTFDESSYEGNPLLCGPPLHNNCSNTVSPPTVSTEPDDEGEHNLLDMSAFCVSFLISFAAVLLGIFSSLCINPYWRKTWFSFIEDCITTCRFSIVGNVFELYIFRRNA